MKEKISLIYKILIVVVSGIGLYLNFKLYSFKTAILYFTNLSNILVFLFYLVGLILYFTKKLKKNDTYYIIKGMITMAITITMFVYQIILSGSMNTFVGHEVENAFVHLIVPFLVIFDYIIFGKKGNLKKNYPFIWSFILIVYQLFVIIYSLLGGKFMGSDVPYPYMDISKNGIWTVILNCVLVYVFFVGYGTIVQTLDNKLGKNNK